MTFWVIKVTLEPRFPPLKMGTIEVSMSQGFMRIKGSNVSTNQPATCRRCSANPPFFLLDVEQQSCCPQFESDTRHRHRGDPEKRLNASQPPVSGVTSLDRRCRESKKKIFFLIEGKIDHSFVLDLVGSRNSVSVCSIHWSRHQSCQMPQARVFLRQDCVYSRLSCRILDVLLK